VGKWKRECTTLIIRKKERRELRRDIQSGFPCEKRETKSKELRVTKMKKGNRIHYQKPSLRAHGDNTSIV